MESCWRFDLMMIKKNGDILQKLKRRILWEGVVSTAHGEVDLLLPAIVCTFKVTVQQILLLHSAHFSDICRLPPSLNSPLPSGAAGRQRFLHTCPLCNRLMESSGCCCGPRQTHTLSIFCRHTPPKTSRAKKHRRRRPRSNRQQQRLSRHDDSLIRFDYKLCFVLNAHSGGQSLPGFYKAEPD